MGIATLKKGQAELPTPKSSHSYWHREPSKTLFGHRTTKCLPPTADVVIIGSGVTSAFAALELKALGRSVLMLEAREACWGATGRNGGHCRPDIHLNEPHMAHFELATFNMIRSMVKQYDIACNWRTVGGVRAIFTQEELDVTRKNLGELQRDHPDLASKVTLVTDRALLDTLRVPNAVGAVWQPDAAKLWPYKLVAHILESLLQKNTTYGFNLQTTTPVAFLQKNGKEFKWIVHTTRGQVAARDVLLATNAYTSHLLPSMADLIVPVRRQVCALTYPSAAIPLKHTYVWREGLSAHYLIQRDDDKSVILGGEPSNLVHRGVGVSRDDSVDPVVSRHLRHALHSSLKLKAPGEDEDEDLEASYEWTGIMGFSRDELPWVGPIPIGLREPTCSGNRDEGDGLWISAGYNGHGMPRAARCGAAVGRMIAGKSLADDNYYNLPPEFVVSLERVEAARKQPPPDGVRMLGRRWQDI